MSHRPDSPARRKALVIRLTTTGLILAAGAAALALGGLDMIAGAIASLNRVEDVSPDDYLAADAGGGLSLGGAAGAAGMLEGEEPAGELRDFVDLSPLDEHRRVFEIDSIAPREPSDPFELPEESNGLARMALSRMLDGPTLDVAVRIPGDKLPSWLASALSDDGQLLYLVDVDNRIIVSEIATKKVLFRGESPLAGTYAILPEGDGSRVYLLGEGAIALYDRESKAEVARLEVPGRVDDWERAAEKGTIVAVTSDMRMFVVDADLGRIRVLEETKLDNNNVSIRPDGLYAIAAAGGDLVRWHFDRAEGQLERLKCDMFQTTDAVCCSENDADRWFDIRGMQEYVGEVHTKGWHRLQGADPLFMNISVMTADTCMLENGRASGAIVAGWVTDKGGYPSVAIGRPHFHTMGPLATTQVPVDCKRILYLTASRDGRHVAVLTDRELLIAKPPAADDTSGELTAYNLSWLLYDDRLELLDEIAGRMRARDWPRQHISGERMFALIAECVAQHWVWAESNQAADQGKEVFDRLERWKEAGGDLAMCGSAMRHETMGWRARGGGYASTVTAQGFAEFEGRMGTALRDLDPVLAGERPPAFAFERYAACLPHTATGTLDDAIVPVARCMQLHPSYMRVHYPILEMLLPRWYGCPTAGHQYADAVARHYPPALRDQVYAAVFYGPLGEWFSMPPRGEWGIETQRFFDGSDALFSQDALTRDDCERIIGVAFRTNWKSRADRYIDYHLGKYVTTSWSSYREQSRDLIHDRKVEYFASARDAFIAAMKAERAERAEKAAAAEADAAAKPEVAPENAAAGGGGQ